MSITLAHYFGLGAPVYCDTPGFHVLPVDREVLLYIYSAQGHKSTRRSLCQRESFPWPVSQPPISRHGMKKKWFWQKDPIPAGNPEEKIKPAPAWAVYAMLVVWYGAALVLNGTFRSALVQDLGARGAKEAIAAEARMKMGL